MYLLNYLNDTEVNFFFQNFSNFSSYPNRSHITAANQKYGPKNSIKEWWKEGICIKSMMEWSERRTQHISSRSWFIHWSKCLTSLRYYFFLFFLNNTHIKFYIGSILIENHRRWKFFIFLVSFIIIIIIIIYIQHNSRIVKMYSWYLYYFGSFCCSLLCIILFAISHKLLFIYNIIVCSYEQEMHVHSFATTNWTGFEYPPHKSCELLNN